VKGSVIQLCHSFVSLDNSAAAALIDVEGDNENFCALKLSRHCRRIEIIKNVSEPFDK